MGSSTKFLIGALITALLGWLTYSATCKVRGGGDGGNAASGIAADTNAGTLSESGDTAAEAPASQAAVAECQGDINAFMATKPIQFQSGSAYIGGESLAVISELAAEIKKCAGTQIEVQGHTSLTGGADTNQAISQARAQNVVDALVKDGIAKERLIAKGYGASQPLENALTSAANAKNQRTVLVITSAGSGPASGAATPTGGQ
ncbi:MAG: OmpA family protein [Sphingomonadales bacterium]|nr:OmpA family protein [Sphingomonadales bacterium]